LEVQLRRPGSRRAFFFVRLGWVEAVQSNTSDGQIPFQSRRAWRSNPAGFNAAVYCLSSCPRTLQPKHRHARAPLALWQAAHALLTALFNLFGAPQDIAAQSTLTKDARTLLLTWLRAAEAIFRRLIFIEASKLSADGPPPSRRHAGKARIVGTHEPPSFDATDPESWRVSLRCAPADSRRDSSQGSRRHRAPRQILARPLAERCEALLRAFNDPAPFALRLARRLNKSNAKRVHDEPPPNARDLFGRASYDSLDFHYRAAFHGVDTG
jgi:hypothetical protein